jgi:hypothetical protein
MAQEAEEDPAEIKVMCIGRVTDVLGYANDCMANFPYQSAIPRDLRNRAEDTITAVFGSSSDEMARYKEYEAQWNSFESNVRWKWLENLRFDLKSGLKKLEATPPRRYAALSYGAVENETKLGGTLAQRLGVPDGNSDFLTRLNGLSRRIQVNIQQDCMDAVAFLLRKALETCIVERFRKDNRMLEITRDGRVAGLEDLLRKASRSSGGFIHPNIVRELLAEKVLMDLTVHSLVYDPAPEDIDRIISRIKAALADLRVGEL